MKRRQFLQRTAFLGASSLVSIGAHGWAWRGVAQSANPPRLIVILLRGAADGLNIVVPYQEPAYYESRPELAIAQPGKADGVLDLDGQFGLHPALEPLVAEWQAGHLAFVHATGLRGASRSHFQAQDYLEMGTPAATSPPAGWLNRLLTHLPHNTSTQAVNIGRTLPLIFTGSESVASLDVNKNGIQPLPIDHPHIQAVFDQLYTQPDPLGLAYQEGRQVRDVFLRELDAEMIAASRGAPASTYFLASIQQLAQLMSGNAGTQLAFLELGGWDTHVNQNPVLNRQLDPLGAGLALLAQELGDVYQNTVVVVMSEFGRTVAQNGNRGTDHGSGNALWIMGGGVRGQQVYGEWPGLDPSEQFESRDLAITTDTRDVLTSLLGQHFGLNDRQLAAIFPNHQRQKTLQLL